MNKSRLTLVILVVPFAVSLVLGQTQVNYKTYSNARFGYSIAYPANILFPQGEATNGDGQKFLSKDNRAELIVYGSHNATDETLGQVYENETKNTPERSNRVVTYKVIKGDWFVVSGAEDGKIFYQKTFLRRGVFKTFRIQYDESDKRVFDSITTKIATSFKG